jgi:transcriptional regulator with XRE-family HTH domain
MNNKDIIARLVLVRDILRIPRAKIATLLNVDYQYLRKVETNKRNSNSLILKYLNLYATLDVDINIFFQKNYNLQNLNLEKSRKKLKILMEDRDFIFIS